MAHFSAADRAVLHTTVRFGEVKERTGKPTNPLADTKTQGVRACQKKEENSGFGARTDFRGISAANLVDRFGEVLHGNLCYAYHRLEQFDKSHRVLPEKVQ